MTGAQVIRRLSGVAAAFVGVAVLAHAAPAAAGPHSDALKRCLSSSVSESDRVAFVRWMFTAMSKHPQVNDLADVNSAERAAATRATADLMDRLILVDCRTQSAAVVRHEGLDELVASFTVVGEVAMEGLMTDPAVSAEFDRLGDGVDNDAWAKFLQEAAR